MEEVQTGRGRKWDPNGTQLEENPITALRLLQSLVDCHHNTSYWRWIYCRRGVHSHHDAEHVGTLWLQIWRSFSSQRRNLDIILEILENSYNLPTVSQVLRVSKTFLSGFKLNYFLKLGARSINKTRKMPRKCKLLNLNMGSICRLSGTHTVIQFLSYWTTGVMVLIARLILRLK